MIQKEIRNRLKVAVFLLCAAGVLFAIVYTAPDPHAAVIFQMRSGEVRIDTKVFIHPQRREDREDAAYRNAVQKIRDNNNETAYVLKPGDYAVGIGPSKLCFDETPYNCTSCDLFPLWGTPRFTVNDGETLIMRIDEETLGDAMEDCLKQDEYGFADVELNVELGDCDTACDLPVVEEVATSCQLNRRGADNERWCATDADCADLCAPGQDYTCSINAKYDIHSCVCDADLLPDFSFGWVP